jgi:hypothetical protein
MAAGEGGHHGDGEHHGEDPEKLHEELKERSEESRADTESFAAHLAVSVKEVARIVVAADRDLKIGILDQASRKLIAPAAEAISSLKPDPRLDSLLHTLAVHLDSFANANAALALREARARFVSTIFGVSAAEPAKALAFADTIIERLRLRVSGREDTFSIPADAATFDTVWKAWKAFDDPKFWASMARLVAVDASTQRLSLSDQLVWMALVADLSPLGPDGWLWESAADKAALVDRLIAAAGPEQSMAKLFELLATLRYENTALPRAVAAELAQLAIASLAGTTASPTERPTLAQILERPAPLPDLTGMSAAQRSEAIFIHNLRETLRTSGRALFETNQVLRREASGMLSEAGVREFRYNLAQFWEVGVEAVRRSVRRSPDGDARVRELDRWLESSRLRNELVLWSEQRRLSAADWVARASVAESLRFEIARLRNEVLKRYGENLNSLESGLDVILTALGAETALEVAEMLSGSPIDVGALENGVRYFLSINRDGAMALEVARVAIARVGLRNFIFAEAKLAAQLSSGMLIVTGDKTPTAWLTALMAAADGYKQARAGSASQMESAAQALIAALGAARTGSATLPYAARRECVIMLDAVTLALAGDIEASVAGGGDVVFTALERYAAALRAIAKASLQTTAPAPGVTLEAFWKAAKNAASAAIPKAERVALEASFSLDLSQQLHDWSAELSRSTLAELVGRAWKLSETLRAYRVAVESTVMDPNVKARLLDALAAISLEIDTALAAAAAARPATV